jgi:hypothetical protein
MSASLVLHLLKEGGGGGVLFESATRLKTFQVDRLVLVRGLQVANSYAHFIMSTSRVNIFDDL